MLHMSKTTTISMDDLLESTDVKQLKTGDMVEGTILSVRKHEVWVDLGPNGIGVVMQRELHGGQTAEIGEKIITSVVDPEMEDGYALLSMKRVEKDRGW